jgi:ketosteroid isomerase-like protein
MSQENVEVVRGVLAAWDQGDREAALAYVDDDVVVDATRRHFNPMTYVGREGLRQMAIDIDEVWADFRMDVLELIDAGDRVVLVVHAVGKGKASGVEIEMPGAQVITIRDGRIVRWVLGFADRRQALESEGLRE